MGSIRRAALEISHNAISHMKHPAMSDAEDDIFGYVVLPTHNIGNITVLFTCVLYLYLLYGLVRNWLIDWLFVDWLANLSYYCWNH